MFSSRDKIVKKNKDEKPTDIEEEVAKALFDLENKETQLKDLFQDLYITNAREFTFKDKKGSTEKKGLIVCVPYKSLHTSRKLHQSIVEELERKFKKPVVLIANRAIVSKRAPHHKSQKRPISRTLTAVHHAILEDIVYPAQITGQRCRVKTDGSKHYKVFLDPIEKDATLESKLEALAQIYGQLTTKRVEFVFDEGISRPQ